VVRVPEREKMAQGDLEAKVGELSGQLKILTPTLDGLGKKLAETRETLVEHQETVKQLWIEVNALKAAQGAGSRRWWEIVLAFLSAVVGALATWFLAKGSKP
jgi:hypothetical protein